MSAMHRIAQTAQGALARFEVVVTGGKVWFAIESNSRFNGTAS